MAINNPTDSVHTYESAYNFLPKLFMWMIFMWILLLISTRIRQINETLIKIEKNQVAESVNK